ncbi:MAG: hypothetical protein M3Y75_05475 [Actinomycetota bacterium]|nr:hypothetical protein [Actinomycetota bacterium]
MALFIGSVGGGASSRQLTLVHTFGLLLGSVSIGLLLWLVGAAVRPVVEGFDLVALLVGAVLAAWAVRVAVGRGLPFPSSRWQVPQQWRHTLPAGFTAGAYGFLLGVGFLTSVVLPVYWLFVGMSLLVSDLFLVLLAWCIYGGVRAVVTAREARVVSTAADIGSVPAHPRHFAPVRLATCALLVVAAGLVVA